MSDTLQFTFMIFGGPSLVDPGKTTTRVEHRGLARLSQLKTGLAFRNSADGSSQIHSTCSPLRDRTA
jgi:hypothetical protein